MDKQAIIDEVKRAWLEQQERERLAAEREQKRRQAETKARTEQEARARLGNALYEALNGKAGASDVTLTYRGKTQTFGLRGGAYLEALSMASVVKWMMAVDELIQREDEKRAAAMAWRKEIAEALFNRLWKAEETIDEGNLVDAAPLLRRIKLELRVHSLEDHITARYLRYGRGWRWGMKELKWGAARDCRKGNDR